MTRLLFAGVASLALLSACNQADNAADGAGDAVNAVQDAAAGPVGQASAATLGANTVDGYVTNAAMADMYEIQAAKIAQTKSSNAGVKDLAEMINTDHTASSTKLKSIAPTAAPDVTLPTELDQRRKGMIDNLNAASAADFDKVYLQQQVAAHEEALTLHQGFSDNTEQPALAGLAKEVTPKIQMHLDKAKELLAGM